MALGHLLKRIRASAPATKLSIALAVLTTSILLTGSALGLVPDHRREAAELRLRFSESLGMQLWVSARQGDRASLESLTRMTLNGHPELKSLLIETFDSGFSFSTDGHEELWRSGEADKGVVDRIRLPLSDGHDVWGALQLCYEPAAAGWLSAGARLALFVGLLGFITYRLYLRKVLSYLDPSSVIPERVKTMLDTMSEGVFVMDHREQILLANAAFERVSGLTTSELQGRKASQLAWLPEGPEEATLTLPWLDPATDSSTTTGVTLRMQREDGEVRTLVVNATPILGGDGARRGTLATFDDVSAIEMKNARLEQMVRELKEVRQKVETQNDELRHIASRDALTGCFNRRALFERFDAEWNSSERYGHGVACIMLDLDHFKQINDNHGHATGDQVLQRTVAVLERETRTSDVVGRYGGEEFCIVLTHADIDAAALVAEKLRGAIAAEQMAGLRITASIGVSSQGLGAASPQDLIDEADRALYAAKHGGRNAVVRWDTMPEDTVPDEFSTSTAAEPIAEPSTPIPYHAVTALMSALAQRDAGTAAHCRRVADLCMIAAEDLMSAGDGFVLEVAALLHDIGKIGVPDAVLLKPGKLTDEEWAIMETHDQIGIEIINSAFHSPELTAIVRNHHASFGGDARDPGLPTGHDIPLRARLLTIADAYDAMVSDRVYRKGMSQADAFAELRRCAGTQFDPDLVERFIETITARDAGRSPQSPDESMEQMLRLGLATERLAAAMESSDVSALAAQAGRLGAVAVKQEWDDIARLALQLSETTVSAGEVDDLLATTRELVKLCQSTQGEFLAAKRGGRGGEGDFSPGATGDERSESPV